jgi:hypothetical protein
MTNKSTSKRPRIASQVYPARSIAQINRAIKHLGLELVRGDGYFYFVSLDPAVGQVGESIMVCYLNQQALARWIEDAKNAIKENK